MFDSLQIHSICFLLLSTLACLNSYADDDDDNNSSSKQTTFSVHINTRTQAITGIQTLELDNAQLSPEIQSFAVRVNLTPLINTRKEYFIVLAQQETARINLQQTNKNIQRLQNLHRDQAVSTRKLRNQQTQLKIEQVLFNSAQQQSSNIFLYTQEKWGKTLSHWFLTDEYPFSNMLNTLNKTLYLVYLPISMPTSSNTIYIQPFGVREKAQSASFIADAPVFENDQQQAGTPAYYLSDQAVKEQHQRVTAWLPVKEDNKSGVIIPASSLVWHLGQAFVYLQVDDEQFKRIKITRKKLLNSDSYFIQKELQQGDIVVSAGAQMILSEEFRGLIPAEDDDDDD